MTLNNIIKNLTTPESNGRKIGAFRIVFGLFGGLIVSYLTVTLFAILAPTSKPQSLVVSLYLYTFVWACCFLWISLSISKIIVILRVFIPSLIFSTLILILK